MTAPEIIDEIAVRMELVNACALAGSRREFSRQHSISVQYICDVIHGIKSPGALILRALGYQRVVRYRKSCFASGAVPHRPGNSPATTGAFHSS